HAHRRSHRASQARGHRPLRDPGDRASPRRVRCRHRHHRPAGPRVRLSPEGCAVPRHRHVARGWRGTPGAPLGVPLKRLAPLAAAVMLVASCVTSPSESSLSPTTSIEAYLAQLENDDSFSGVVMVAKDFVPFATKATGYADRARGAPNATITPFNIASITKIFTAVAIGQLVDQGKVSLEDPLTKYLPTYPRTPGDQITIAMLISQTAGTGNYRDDPGYLRVRDSFESISALLGAVNTAVTPGAVPGKTFSFS